MKNTLKARIESILGYDLKAKLEQPKDKNLAHYAMPVFVLAKELKKSPPQIATEIAEKLNSSANNDFSAEAVGGYVNFKLNAGFLNDFATKALKNPADFAKIDFNEKTGVATLGSVLAKIDLSDDNKFDLGENLVDADHNLFGALRYFDDKDNIETIYVQGFNEGEESLAYMNRLNKAAGGHHLNK